jgi:hypothetical protein
MRSGGKNPGAARAWTLLQAGKAFLVESLAPLADHLSPGFEATSDFIIVKAFCCQQDHFGTLYLKIRQRISACPRRQFLFFIDGQCYPKWACSWHPG